jgi:hypothetical protein
MLLRGLIVASLLLSGGVAFAKGNEEIETRRERREREQMEFLLTSLIKAKLRKLPEFFDAANSPLRCAEIEYYLRQQLKLRAEIQELALLVEAHDPKLVPTRIYRVKYEGRKGKAHEHDFLMQQHGAEWRVHAHLPALEIRIVKQERPPTEAPPSAIPPVGDGDALP